ncbi:hypothetical protein [Streptomyces sp. SID13031]|uniref:DUF6912 family protein n=1 Tax=Streptomyces sp. SID13031 TaxID=2706046 RepID=UPI0013CA2067|nr:hypothetical protein [Streptomyces sp. SID13031]NEA30969.1 hypothetical protein [Streptomyces sp. SID13031]
MRIYIPSTIPLLDAACHAGEFGPAPLTAYAVTPALREWFATADDEELEYAAMEQAARASVGLVAAAPDAPRKRVVVACDVSAIPPADGTVQLGDARLELHVVIPWSAVAAAHIDGDPAVEVVATAAKLWDVAHGNTADPGHEEAVFALDSCEGEDLLWYATQEIPDFLAAEGPRGIRGRATS